MFNPQKLRDRGYMDPGIDIDKGMSSPTVLQGFRKDIV